MLAAAAVCCCGWATAAAGLLQLCSSRPFAKRWPAQAASGSGGPTGSWIQCQQVPQEAQHGGFLALARPQHAAHAAGKTSGRAGLGRGTGRPSKVAAVIRQPMFAWTGGQRSEQRRRGGGKEQQQQQHFFRQHGRSNPRFIQEAVEESSDAPAGFFHTTQQSSRAAGSDGSLRGDFFAMDSKHDLISPRGTRRPRNDMTGATGVQDQHTDARNKRPRSHRSQDRAAPGSPDDVARAAGGHRGHSIEYSARPHSSKSRPRSSADPAGTWEGSVANAASGPPFGHEDSERRLHAHAANVPQGEASGHGRASPDGEGDSRTSAGASQATADASLPFRALMRCASAARMLR